MRKVLWIALWVGQAGVLAQSASMGTGGAGGGYGGAGYGVGPMIARVAVGPNGFNPGLQGLGGAGGGLHGVTRWTFMSEPNALASQFFRSAGVPVGGTSGVGTAGGQAVPGFASNLVAAGTPSPAPAKEPPLPPATLAGVAVPVDEAPAMTAATENSTQPPAQASTAPGQTSRSTGQALVARTPRSETPSGQAQRAAAPRRHR